jgi:hypothetical protein
LGSGRDIAVAAYRLVADYLELAKRQAGRGNLIAGFVVLDIPCPQIPAGGRGIKHARGGIEAIVRHEACAGRRSKHSK